MSTPPVAPIHAEAIVAPPPIPAAPSVARPFRLRPGRVEIWRIDLDEHRHRLAEMREVLVADESQRAGRFRTALDTDLYVLTRGWVRMLLGAHLAVDPRLVVIERGWNGKPFLGQGQGRGDARFNVSHSGSLACVAITLDHEVGVDVERISAGVATDRLAERFFSPGEVAALDAVEVENRDEAFFTCWARKEAYVKALGSGLAEPLDRFEVSVLPGQQPALVEVAGRPGEAARWTMLDVPVGDGYVGALAVRGTGLEVGYWRGP